MSVEQDTSAALFASVGDRLDGSPLAVMLDVDGTLAPIAPTPSNAAVPHSTRSAIRELATLPDVVLALVSGRSATDAWRLAGVAGAWVLGNHGTELRTPGGDLTVDERIRSFEDAIERAARILSKEFESVSGVIVENKRWTLSLHYRLVEPRETPALVARAQEVAGTLGLRVLSGKKIVELRPPVSIDKGTASVAFAQRVGALGASGSAMYAGDDRTDEDAFQALRSASARAVTMRILSAEDGRGRPSAAEFLLHSTEELRDLLEFLVARRTRGSARV